MHHFSYIALSTLLCVVACTPKFTLPQAGTSELDHAESKETQISTTLAQEAACAVHATGVALSEGDVGKAMQTNDYAAYVLPDPTQHTLDTWERWEGMLTRWKVRIDELKATQVMLQEDVVRLKAEAKAQSALEIQRVAEEAETIRKQVTVLTYFSGAAFFLVLLLAWRGHFRAAVISGAVGGVIATLAFVLPRIPQWTITTGVCGILLGVPLVMIWGYRVGLVQPVPKDEPDLQEG